MGRLLREAYDLEKEIVLAYCRTATVRPERGPCIGGWENTVWTSTSKDINHKEVGDAFYRSGSSHEQLYGSLSAGTWEEPFDGLSADPVRSVQTGAGKDRPGSGGVDWKHAVFRGFDTAVRESSCSSGPESF